MTHRAGFTLIEVLAVLFLTAIVFGVALNFYVDLSNQSAHASEATREVRRAASLLDRLARDFERALLVQKPPETDPLAHPWIFVADARYAEHGADRVKFVMRHPADRRTPEGDSDIVMVSYALRPRAEGDYEIVRWSRPSLPEALDRDFPPTDDPDALVLADGISRFELRFLDADGEWLEEWDSSQLLETSELPRAVEITLALSPEHPEADQTAESQPYVRRVMLPVRPLDLAVLLDPEAYAAAAGEATDQQQCELTVADCIDLTAVGVTGDSQEAVRDLSRLGGLSAEDLQAVRELSKGNLGDLCWDSFREAYGNHPAVKPQCR